MNGENKTLEHIIQRMQQDDSVDAPVDARRNVENLFRSRIVAPDVPLLRRVIAVLTMELAPGRAAFGERSGALPAARQMLFSAGEAAIDLRIEESGDKFDVRGQVLRDGFADGTAVLDDGETAFETTLDELTGFRFARVEPRRYQLTIRSVREEIVIEDLLLQ